MLALIRISPPTILQIIPTDIGSINVADTWQVQGVAAGYATPDGVYKVVTIVPAVVPGGQMATGPATYSINGQVVTQTIPTQALPANTFIPYVVFLSRLTDVEYTNIKKAIATQITGGNATVARWYDKIMLNGIDTTDANTATIKALAVTASLLTQARADLIFTP